MAVKSWSPMLLLCAAVAGCGSSDPQAIPGVTGKLEFGRKAFWSAPFPSEDLREGGVIKLPGFPNPTRVALVEKTLALLARDASGFGVSSGVFLPFTGQLPQPLLPSVDGSQQPGAKVFLLSIDEDAPDAFTRRPVHVSFEPDAGPFGPSNLLSLLPVQGRPLAPRHAYAAVVRRTLLSESGHALGVSLPLALLLAGQRPAALGDEAFALYQRAIAALGRAGVPRSDVAALAAFTTGDPTAQLALVRDDALTHPAPLPAAPLKLLETWPDYCVFSGTVKLPVYQAGSPPYTDAGGGWSFDALGIPQYQRQETANLFVTLPRAPMPTAGWPSVLYVRAGGSGLKPLVDRGPRPAAGQPYLAGAGPAMHFAQVGYAGVEVDGPLGGRRNPNNGDEQFLVFNFLNPEALRDNIRQSAVELSLMARALGDLVVDARGCGGVSAGVQKFDPGHLAIWGHSTGATIAPLAAAVEPKIRAAILSGSGGSYLENVLWKLEPVDVKAFAETLLGYTTLKKSLTGHDPIVSLIQWASEPADPQVYASQVITAPTQGAGPRHVLQFQGIVDHYILPPLVQAVALPLGLDAAGPALDLESLYLRQFTPLDQALATIGRSRLPLPVQGNLRGGTVTAVNVQALEDGLEDGHEVVFQQEGPKHQYRCFLQSWAVGVPKIPLAGAATDPCQ